MHTNRLFHKSYNRIAYELVLGNSKGADAVVPFTFFVFRISFVKKKRPMEFLPIIIITGKMPKVMGTIGLKKTVLGLAIP